MHRTTNHAQEARFTARKLACLAVLAIWTLVGCGGKAGEPSDPATSGATTTTEIDLLHPLVLIETSAGNIIARLDGDRSPLSSTAIRALDDPAARADMLPPLVARYLADRPIYRPTQPATTPESRP